MDYFSELSLMSQVLIYTTIVCFIIYNRLPLWVFSTVTFGTVFMLDVSVNTLLLVLIPLVVISVSPIRAWILSFPIYSLMLALKFLPTISQTEKEAIESGTTWVDAEMFSGSPNYKKIMSQTYAELTEEELTYVNGPIEKLCEMVDDWEVFKKRDFPKKIFDFIKQERLFGMIIPKKYGGLGFSPIANSTINSKISSRCNPLGTIVMVPNSLGPAELLVHYGTEEQKDYYLPRLAVAKEIPCFALTEPHAGSDAGGMRSTGHIFTGEDGKPWIRLNFEKRYITLAPIATLIGLAFKLFDPEQILGKEKVHGITCALIPRETKGIEVGLRHDPLGVPFYNGPLNGKNVEIPLSLVIGGEAGIGKGWKMLMECLSAGRGITLPAVGSACIKSCLGVSTAYSMIRKQFGLEIGEFEGIQEPLAEITGMNYILEAARKFTCGGLAQGEKPAVISAICKYHFTEMGRKAINHAMDVCGGAGISLGPRNLLGHAYISQPIGITVEGANILTRNLMIFGQGAIRCHPYVLDEVKALEEKDIYLFDKTFWKHVGHVNSNFLRLVLFSLTRGRHQIPFRWGPSARYYQKLSWASAKFAFYTDLVLLIFGGSLKVRERITARFGDVLSWMYLGVCVLRRFEADGRRNEDIPFLKWSMQYCLNEIQVAFESIFKNMGPAFILSQFFTRLNPISGKPSDKVETQMLKCVLKPTNQR